MYHITDGGRKGQGTNIITLLGREKKEEGKGRPVRREHDAKTSIEEKGKPQRMVARGKGNVRKIHHCKQKVRSLKDSFCNYFLLSYNK